MACLRSVTSPVSAAWVARKVPAVLGDHETGWCTPCVPYAGKDAGMAFLPEKDAGVWIEFEGGDVSFPIWVGCYWHTGERPSIVAPATRTTASVACRTSSDVRVKDE